MIKSSITHTILDLTLYALLSVIWLSVPSYSWAKGDDRLITNRSVLYIPHSVHHSHCKKAVDIGINPSSPNIHIQILQADLHIFPYRIRTEIDKRSRHFGSYNCRQTTSSGFKDISRTNYSVQGLRFIQWIAFFNPLGSPYWLKHAMESFMIFTFSAIVHHIILHYFPQQDFAKWLGMKCNCI